MKSARVATFLALCASAHAGPVLTLPSGVSAGSLTVSTYASGLSFPYSLQPLSDGSLLAGISTPQSGGDYVFATGGLMRFASLQDPGATVYSGLPYPVQSVRAITSDLVAVAQAGAGASQITFLKPGANSADPYSSLGSISLTPSNPGQIFNITLATRPTPGQSGSYDLFFSMNGEDHTQSQNVATLGGLATGTMEYSSVAKVTVTPGSGAPSVSGFQQIARGLRNTAGMVFDAAGNLYLNDNGWDVPDTLIPQSTDELNFLAAAQLGTGIADFGFPNSYTEYGTGNFIGGGGIAPVAAFQPISGFDSFGISEMALAPVNFPTGLNNGLFIAFYGKWEQAGANNTTGPLLYYDFATHLYQPFILSGQTGIGHMASLAGTPDALYIGDMNSFGTVRHGPIDGVIYQISATSTPEPGTLIAGLGLGLLLRSAKIRHSSFVPPPPV